MFVEDQAIGIGRRRQTAVRQSRHDLAQNSGVIFRLHHALGARDADNAKILAQPRQWTLVQEAGEIIRAIRQQLAAAETDEQIEELAFDAMHVGMGGGFGERDMRHPERAGIAAQLGQIRQQLRVRRACEQRGDQRVFLRARRIHFVDVAGHLFSAVQIGPQSGAIDAGDGFDRNDPLRGNASPVGDGRLRNTNLTRKLADTAGGANSLG